MSIAQITLEGFKSLTNHTFNFSPDINIITAKNGVGKSSLADAIAFVYCGTDRYGNAKPLHLINKDCDGCKVTVTSDKGVQIVRTLTSKKNGSIKVIRDGIPNSINQTHLNGLLGPRDVFLSAIMPGYFMALTPSNRKIVLREVLPKVDPYAIVEEKTGQDIRGKYDLSKKSAADTIAIDRRAIDKQVSQIEGNIQTLNEARLPERPSINPEVYTTIDNYKKLVSSLELSEKLKNSYRETIEKINYAEAKTHTLNQNVKLWQDELAGLVIVDEPRVIDKTPEISDLLATKTALPARPALMKEVSSERCPTCGTPVTRKMRDTVKATNDKLLADYEKAEQAANERNKSIDIKVQALREQYNLEMRALATIRKDNERAEARKAQLESKLEFVEYPKIPATPERPAEPNERLDVESYNNALSALKSYEAARAVYDSEKTKLDEADKKIEFLQGELLRLKQDLEVLQGVERVVKQLSDIVLDRSNKQLEVPGLIDVFFLDGDLRVRRDDVPYTALSTGQKMRVDFELSQKINGLMSNPINLYFIDDSDLLDTQLVPHHPAQMMYTLVQEGQEDIKVDHNV